MYISCLPIRTQFCLVVEEILLVTLYCFPLVFVLSIILFRFFSFRTMCPLFFVVVFFLIVNYCEYKGHCLYNSRTAPSRIFFMFFFISLFFFKLRSGYFLKIINMIRKINLKIGYGFQKKRRIKRATEIDCICFTLTLSRSKCGPSIENKLLYTRTHLHPHKHGNIHQNLINSTSLHTEHTSTNTTTHASSQIHSFPVLISPESKNSINSDEERVCSVHYIYRAFEI